MKKISIKLRITLWFTTFMMMLVGILFLVIMVSGNRISRGNLKSELDEIVKRSAHSLIIVDDGVVSKDKFRGFHDGIYLTVYDSHGNLLFGELPSEISNEINSNISFHENEMQTLKINSKTWYVYDLKYKVSSFGFVWIRGIVCDHEIYNSRELRIRILMYVLPLFVIAVAVGGYHIINKAFRPINRIVEAADKIGEGKDLSERINLGNGTDEIYMLAHTFDRMFDRIEDFFEHEKQFTSDASHELRTPTSVIISQCEYALENAETVEEAKESLSQVLSQAKKMTALITQLLTLARADKGEEKLNLEQLNLSELTEMVVEHLSEIADEKSITIQSNIEPNVNFKGDETMLMRMLINLIENGINYGKESSILSVELKRIGKEITIMIEDQGIGIAPEHMDKIWERFYRVDQVRNTAMNNTGLGLSMVKWIVHAHGGSVKVESELNKGSVFTVTLPYEV